MRLNELTITSARQKLDIGEISSLDLTSACLKRIKQVNKKFHACLLVDEKGALQAAKEADQRLKNGEKSMLLGIPFLAKDNIMTKNLVTTAGSKMLKKYIAPFDATEKRLVLPVAVDDATVSNAPGVVVPIPTPVEFQIPDPGKYAVPETERFVVEAFIKEDAVVDVATKLDAVTTPSIKALPATESFSVGVLEPMPTFPACAIRNSDVPVVETTPNTSFVVVACKVSIVEVDVVPTEKFLVIKSRNCPATPLFISICPA
jgi:hypothetical protein